ncbi:hypothetical protein AB0J38_00175 [Streptomyces sp. NPDC050095]|uniref:hypothetical protein n=1 Tax=unclassified Streptomyces TaxID=2593676 RepID=UPI003437C766
MGTVTPAQVCDHMGMDPARLTEQDTRHLSVCCSAVDVMVPGTVPRVRLIEQAAPGSEWPPDVQLAATMQAARLFARRNSPTGVASYGETSAFVARFDPDLEQLLHVGKWAPPSGS